MAVMSILAGNEACKILIKNGRLVDPCIQPRSSWWPWQSRVDVSVRWGHANTDFTADRVIDATGLVVAPGLVDLAARLREPGHEHEGMLESELAAAAAGGVTSVVCCPIPILRWIGPAW